MKEGNTILVLLLAAGIGRALRPRQVRQAPDWRKAPTARSARSPFSAASPPRPFAADAVPPDYFQVTNKQI